jgi:hypothetical protein
MFYVGTDTYLMDEEKYSAITSLLGALERKLKPKLAEHSRILKDAGMQQWDSEISGRLSCAP